MSILPTIKKLGCILLLCMPAMALPYHLFFKPNHELSFNLPQDTAIASHFSKGYLYNNTWRYGANEAYFGRGHALLQINYPTTVQSHCPIGPGACHNKTFIRISSSNDSHALRACLIPRSISERLGFSVHRSSQNQEAFYSGSDAGMMHQLAMVGYAKRLKHTCLVVEVFDTSVGGQAHHRLAQRLLDQMVSRMSLD